MSCLFKRFPTLSLLQWHQETGWLNQQPRSCEDKSIQNSTTSPLFSISGNISWIEKTEPGNEANSFYFICLKWVVLLWLVCSAGILQSHEPEVVEYMLLGVWRALHLPSASLSCCCENDSQMLSVVFVGLIQQHIFSCTWCSKVLNLQGQSVFCSIDILWCR